MILVIDNYDSFTYNLVQYFGELGAELLVKRNDEISLADIEKLAPEKIVVSPGPCTPSDAGISCDVIRHFGGKIPIFGVCLGHQSIGQVYGVPQNHRRNRRRRNHGPRPPRPARLRRPIPPRIHPHPTRETDAEEFFGDVTLIGLDVFI